MSISLTMAMAMAMTMTKTWVAGARAARSQPFWLELEPFFWSGSYSYSTGNILFLRDPKYEYKYD